MSEALKKDNEYRFLAKMYTEVYKEKEKLNSQVKTLLEENLKLSNELFKIKKGKI